MDRHFQALKDPSVKIWCHNAQFEMAICAALFKRTFGLPCPDVSRFRCTANLARRAGLPHHLGKLAETLGLEQQKDKRGAQLIKLFSVMQPARRSSKKNPKGLPPYWVMPNDRPAEFAEFRRYCAQDVRTEQAVYRKLAYFSGGLNDRTYTLDAKINARGVTVNLGALRNAKRIIEEEEKRVGDEFRKLTGLNPTQNAKFLGWLESRGYRFPNLQAETLADFMDSVDPLEDEDVVRAIQLKQHSAYAAVKKVEAMLDCAGPHDNRLRGMLVHHGATTGRWTSERVQLQNAKRPAKGLNTEAAYREICSGVSRAMLEFSYGPPLEVIASCIRHFIHAPEGFFDADYSAIEARIICWLAGQEDALDLYRKGEDRYRVMASAVFGVPVSRVDTFQRWVGKQIVLGCGYQMGPVRFREMCSQYGQELPKGLEFKAVSQFRAKHPRIVQFWNDMEIAARCAILVPDQRVEVGKVSFVCITTKGIPFLLMRLPSGRELAYPYPTVANGTLAFFGNIQGEVWGGVYTFGGKLAENATQAVAADIMGAGALAAEAAGYEIATLIHDQALAYRKPGQTIEGFVDCLTTLPEWAEGLPIAAEGKECKFYSKG
jgi:DNA polymerase